MFVQNMKRDKEYILPLTELQQEMLFSISSGIYKYVEKVTVRFEEEIEKELFEGALNKLIQLQPMLRGIFRWKELSEPIMIVLKMVSLPFYYGEERPEIDIEKEPWNIVISKDLKTLTFTYSHMIMDGWSLSCFFEQLFSFYSGRSKNEKKVNLSMRHYMLGMKKHDFSVEKEYWNKYWDSYDPVLLSASFRGNLVPQGSMYHNFLEENDFKKLREYACELGVTVSSILYAAWGLLISSYTRKSDICMGYISSGRNNKWVELDSVGMHIKSLPLRINIEGVFGQVCKEIATSIIDNSRNENASNQIIYGSTGEQRRKLYDSLVVVENYPLDIKKMSDIAGINIASFDFYEDVSYPYVIQIQLKDKIEIELTGEDNISYGQLESLGKTYIDILKQISHRKFKHIEEVDICGEDHLSIEEYEKSVFMDKTKLASNLAKYIEMCCRSNKNKIAIRDLDKQYSYGDILETVIIASNVLRENGVINNTPVGVYMGRSAKMLLAVYSILFAGGTYLPIALSVPEDRMKYMINNSQAKILICEDSQSKEELQKVNMRVTVLTFAELLNGSNSRLYHDYSCDNTAYILYTSGTTGQPKGVEISHKAILNRLIWNSKELCITADDIQVFKTPISFDVSIIEIFQIFFNQHQLVILPEKFEKMPDKIIEYILKYKITYLHFVPSMFAQFITYVEVMKYEECLKYLRRIICSGEVLYADIVNSFYNLNHSTNVDVINLYGPTEAAVDVSSYVCSKKQIDGIIPIGKPIYNTELRILDHLQRRCKPYIIGELYILGENLGKGYINDVVRTEECYLTLNDGNRCYYTGDLAYWDTEGNITVIGRNDSQIKFNGVRIECEEMRSFLIQNKVVTDAELVLKKDKLEKLILFYTGNKKEISEIKEVLRKKFPEYMLPSEYCYLDEMPLTQHGKRDIKKLVCVFNHKMEIMQNQDINNLGLNETEQRLAKIWESILGDIVNLRKDSNFFQYGGTSLMIVSMVTKIKKEFDVVISTAEVYNNLILCDLALLINEKLEKNHSNEEMISKIESINSVQRGMAAIQLADKTSTAYNMPVLIKINSQYSLHQIFDTFSELLKQEDYLRSVFVNEDGNLKKEVLEYHPIEYKCTKIKENELDMYTKAFVQPFLLEKLLIRIEFLSTEKSNYMLFDIHHILCDQEVLHLIMKNLIRILDGKEIVKIEEKYRDDNNSEEYSRHKNYWDKLFSRNNESVILPKDKISIDKVKTLMHWRFILDSERLQLLKKFAISNRTTTFNILLTAYIILTGKLSNKEYSIIGTNYINQTGTWSTGMGLEILPIKVDTSKHKTLSDILRQTIVRFSEAVENNKYSYNELVKDLSLYSADQHNPLFDMMFVKEEDYYISSGLSKYFDKIESISNSAKFDISLFYHEYENEIVFCFDYNSKVYNKTTIIFFAEAYIKIIDLILNNNKATIQDLDVMSASSQEEYFSPCFGKRKKLREVSVQQMMVEQAKLHPSDIAIICGKKVLTYEKFNELTNVVANGLDRYDVENKLVILSMNNSELFLIALFAVLKAGGIYLPIDATLPVQKKQYIISDSDAVLIIKDLEEDFLEELPCVDIHSLLNHQNFSDICKGNFDSNAYCIYTSGSTGKPKGCVVQQKGLVNYVDWSNHFYCRGEHKTFAFYTSPAVDMSITSTVMPLACGHTIVVYPDEVSSILNVLQDERIQIVKATPSHLSLIKKDMWVTSSIETFIVGGENLTTKLARETYNKFSKKVHIYNEYGPTETVVGCMIYEYSEYDTNVSVPIGLPIQNMFTVVLDENNKMCAPYTKGELYIGGFGVIQGYKNNKTLTEQKFVKNTINKNYSETMYASGDIARVVVNGNLEYDGRNDSQVKVNGRRIELGEISVAATKLNNIVQAIALQKTGKDGIILYYEEGKDKKWKESEFRKELSKYLPYYMMPVHIISLEKMPIAGSGKIDTKALLRLEPKKEKVNNSIKIKEFLMDCVAKVIGHNGFSEYDGFFEIGLNSLSIHSVQQLVSKKYNIDVMDLFRYPSVFSLSNYLSDTKEDITQSSDKDNDNQYAIVGLGFQIRGAESLEELRQVFQSSKSMISYPSGQRYEDIIRELEIRGYSHEEYKMGMNASLERIDLFDPNYYKMGKDEADALDPVQRLFIMNVTKALHNAGFTKESLNGSRTAIIGAKPMETGYTEFLEQAYPEYAEIAKINKVQSIMLTRLQHFYNLTGPSYLIDSACSSGLVAMNEACKHLQNRECDAAVVGGVNLIELSDTFNKKRAEVLSNSFHAATFSDTATGTARGEGCICYVIKRLSDAIKDNNKVYALVRGISINNDGFSSSLTAPNGFAQSMVIKDALRAANLKPEDVGLVETHGTATPLGDPIEIQALAEAYFDKESSKQFCALSATKAVYGHMDSISGLMGILKCLVSLKYKEIYSNFQIVAPNRRIDFLNSPFYVPISIRKWEKNSTGTRFCGINNFGLNGTNVHMILQQWPVENDDITPYEVSTGIFKNIERCWIDSEPKSKLSLGFNKVMKEEEDFSKNITLQEVQNNLLEKVQQLFPNNIPDVNDDLYSLGFDSISIIQLQQYINITYSVNIDIAYFFEKLNTLALLAQNIVETYENKRSKKTTLLENDEYTVKKRRINKFDHKNRKDTTPDFSSFSLRAFVENFFELYIEKTKNSFEIMDGDKIRWANGRFILGNTKDLESLSYPIIVKKAEGTKLWDVDGNEYLDFAMGFGANFFGYNNKVIQDAVRDTLETDIVLGAIRPEAFSIAEEISKMTGVERVSFCNSGSEAVMNLLRIARAATNRNKVVLFEGSFHGTFDPVFTQANESGGILALPKSIGTPMEYVSQTLVFPYGEDDIFECLDKNYNDIAAVIVEPVQSRHPELRPKEFVQELRRFTEERGILLIFDEVITGFRTGLRGAQEYYNIEADLVSYGKIIGGGFPIGIFAGKSKYMDLIDHKGWSEVSKNKKSGFLVNTGGTFNAHPISIAAATAVCKILKEDGDAIYSHVNSLTNYLATELNSWFIEQSIDIKVEHFCSQFIFLSENMQMLRLMQYAMIYNNIYVWEGGTCFISTEHTKSDINHLIDVVKECSIQIKEIFYNEYSDVKISKYIRASEHVRIKRLLEKHKNVEKVYPMTKQQISVMTANLNNRSKYMDVSYMHFSLKSNMTEEKIEMAFNKAVNSFEALRSVWCWRGVKEPVKLILKQVKTEVGFYYQDDINDEVITDIKSKREKEGFKLNNPPYLTLDVISSNERTDVILFFFTSIIDGWSIDLFLNVLMSNYYGQIINYGGVDYEKYLDWINDDERRQKTKVFWKEYLKEIKVKENTYTQEFPNEMLSLTWNMTEEETMAVKELSKKYSCSQASILIYCYGKAKNGSSADSLVTSTVTGRNPELSGMLESVGMFSNIVPVRIKTGQNIEDGISDIDFSLKRINQLVPLTIDEIAECAEISQDSLRNTVYDSTIVILNQTIEEKKNDMELIEDHGFLVVPLRVYVTIEKTISILFTYDNCNINQGKVNQLINEIKEFLAIGKRINE